MVIRKENIMDLSRINFETVALISLCNMLTKMQQKGTIAITALNDAKNPDEANDRIVYDDRKPLGIDKLNEIINYPIIRTWAHDNNDPAKMIYLMYKPATDTEPEFNHIILDIDNTHWIDIYDGKWEYRDD